MKLEFITTNKTSSDHRIYKDGLRVSVENRQKLCAKEKEPILIFGTKPIMGFSSEVPEKEESIEISLTTDEIDLLISFLKNISGFKQHYQIRK